jgi:NRPS condensation-like uncharacterized protein
MKMMNSTENTIYRRRISPLESFFLHSPYAIVTMTARIKGNVSLDMLRKSVLKLQGRHTNLRLKLEFDDKGDPWLTSQDVQDIPVEVIPRDNDQSWMEVIRQQSLIPFDFQTRPAIRFLLVHTPQQSELVIFCHHMICDGLSLAYLARDLMAILGDPSIQLEILEDPTPIERDNLPPGVKINGLVNYFIQRINNQWQEERVHFTQEDYQSITDAYWSNFNHGMSLLKFSEEQTTQLVEKCKSEEVTVNSALAVGLAAAQIMVEGPQTYHSKITIAGSLRDRLKKPAGESMGFFAGAVSPKFKFNTKIGFWENARRFNEKVQLLYTTKNLFKESLVWSYLDMGILESLTFKMIGQMVPPTYSQAEKLNGFSKREDVISSMLKREKMDSFDNVLIGTAVTNLTRMDFPEEYGDLKLDRLIMNPGGAYPLIFVNLLVGAITCSGKLSLMLEYSLERIQPEVVEKIKEKLVSILVEN